MSLFYCCVQLNPDCLVELRDLTPHTPNTSSSWIIEQHRLDDVVLTLGYLDSGIRYKRADEQQPFRHSETKNWIVGDIRLDNRAELGNILADGHDVVEISDIEFIALAYQRWGADCAKYLLGDFSFVIWDAAARKLLCCRDYIGVCPLFYYKMNDVIVATNDLHTLTQLPQVKLQIREVEVSLYLQYLLPYYHEKTFFEAVYRVMPATVLIGHVQDNITIYQERYWEYPSEVDHTITKPLEHVLALRELLFEAIACRMDCDDLVGSHLSGGLDSTGITILLSALLNERENALHTFSWFSAPTHREINDSADYDIVAQVIRDCGLEHIYFHETGLDLFDFAHQNPAVYPQTGTLAKEFTTQRLAQNEGVQLIFSGWDGNYTISRKGILPQEVENRMGLKTWVYKKLSHFRRRLSSNVQASQASGVESERSLPLPHFDTFIKKDFQAHTAPDLLDLFIEHENTRNQLPADRARHYYTSMIAERIESWRLSGRRTNVTYAFPLLDRRILEYTARLPESLFAYNGTPRALYRMSLKNWLPKELMTYQPTLEETASVKRNPYSRQIMVRLLQHEIQNNVALSDELPWLNIEYLNNYINREGKGWDLQKGRTTNLIRAIQIRTLWHDLKNMTVS